MENIIELTTRGLVKNYLKKLESTNKDRESKTYLLKTNSDQFKTGYNEQNKKYLDPIGSSVIVVGELLEDANAVVKYIDFVLEHGYAITFE